MVEVKLNSLRFGLAGGIVSVISVLLLEIILAVRYLGVYNSLMINIYGVAGISSTDLVRIMFVSILVSFFIGGLLTWFFAYIYNKLLRINIK